MNSWLLLATTKPPTWRDPLVPWVELPATLGQPHEGFFYPDPLGFWAEVRRWSVEIFRTREPTWGQPEALSLTTVLHMADEAHRLVRLMELCRPRVVLFLDEASWDRSGLKVDQVHHYVDDPHRPGQVYEGFWGRGEDGIVVGKAPQHPVMHNLYRADDMAQFLRSAPPPQDG